MKLSISIYELIRSALKDLCVCLKEGGEVEREKGREGGKEKGEERRIVERERERERETYSL